MQLRFRPGCSRLSAASEACLASRPPAAKRCCRMDATAAPDRSQNGAGAAAGDAARSFLRPHLLSLAPYTPIEPFEVLSERLGRDPADIIKLDANENPYGPPPEVLQALGSLSFPNIYPDPESRALRADLSESVGVPAENLLVRDLLCVPPSMRQLLNPRHLPLDQRGNASRACGLLRMVKSWTAISRCCCTCHRSSRHALAWSPATAPCVPASLIQHNSAICHHHRWRTQVGCGADELIDLLMRCVLDPGDCIVDCPPTFTMYVFDAAVNDARVITVPRLDGFRLDIEGAFVSDCRWRDCMLP